MGSQQDSLPILTFEVPEQWADWLEQNQSATGVWLKFAKKGKGVVSVNHDQSLRVALCYGWIDGQAKSLDDVYYLQRFTPRRTKSSWSVRNCKIVEELIVEGKMKPAGQKGVDLAKADGRWDAAYESPSNSTIPQDFLDAVAKNKKANEFFKTLNKTNLYTIYYRLHTAKKPETRAARIEKIVAMLAEGKRFH